jgi:AAHS family 4-hydroxybenzoate transporter-like MFS transporter
MQGTRVVDVGAAVDGAVLRPISGIVLALCLLTAMCDGFDNQALAFTAPAIAREWGIAMPAFAPVFSAGLFGLLLGSMLFGTLADRLGRRRLLLACTVFFGLATLATPFVAGPAQLMAVRFAGGLGIGGVPSAAAALVGETVPVRHRQSFIAWTLIGVPLGGFLGGLVGAACIPGFGWRSVYLIGAAASFAALLACALWLPESNRFLALKGGDGAHLARLMRRIHPAGGYGPGDRFVLSAGEDRRSSVAALFAEGRTRMTLLYWVGSFVNLLIFYFVVNWTPTLFREAGLPAGVATLSTSAVNLGAILFGLVLGATCNRVGTRDAAASTFVVAACGLLLMALTDGAVLPMMAGAFLAGAGAIAGASSLVMFGAESYPTALRSTGVGWALSAGRIGSVISPWVVGIPLGWGWHAQGILLLPLVPALVGAACVRLSRGARPAAPALAALP